MDLPGHCFRYLGTRQMVREIPGTTSRVKGHYTAFSDRVRLVRINILQFQMLPVLWRFNRNRDPYSVLDTGWIGRCLVAGGRRNLGWHIYLNPDLNPNLAAETAARLFLL